MASDKILIVDDSPVFLAELKALIASSGYEVFAASSGAEAIRVAEGRADIGLLICDFNMPGIDGCETVIAIKKIAAYAQLKSLILTTESSPQLMSAGRKAGVFGWIVKPFKGDDVLKVIHMLVK